MSDPNINRRTGKVLDLELDPMAGHPHNGVLHITTLLYTGETNVYKLPWPEDPTDTSEGLVRLLNYLGIDEVAELKGAYVPLTEFGPTRYGGPEDAMKLQIEIPPEPSVTNYALYKAHRALVTRL